MAATFFKSVFLTALLAIATEPTHGEVYTQRKLNSYKNLYQNQHVIPPYGKPTTTPKHTPPPTTTHYPPPITDYPPPITDYPPPTTDYPPPTTDYPPPTTTHTAIPVYVTSDASVLAASAVTVLAAFAAAI
jgi:hypothetical protein